MLERTVRNGVPNCRVDLIGILPMVGDSSRVSEAPVVVGSILDVILASEIIVIGPIPVALAVPVPEY